MTFTVLMYAVGGYAVVFLAGMLVLEHTRGPVRQTAGFSHAGDRPPLRPWPRVTRTCALGHERVLPLRSAQRSVPVRRKRPAPTTCRR
ncbi:MAG: hypothetical protein Q8K79_11340 [Solirubrobacteraceae bacterium]|nr:hypothetical protein [Solirubrobacteraceae bacterium]